MPRRRCDASTPACRTEVVNGQQGQRMAGKAKERKGQMRSMGVMTHLAFSYASSRITIASFAL